MRTDNISMLKDTLKICEHGSYRVKGETVHLKLSKEEMQEAHVFLPDDIDEISKKTDFPRVFSLGGRCGHDCVNMDSFFMCSQAA